jgi:colanic acid biosynthesis protein WcaH
VLAGSASQPGLQVRLAQDHELVSVLARSLGPVRSSCGGICRPMSLLDRGKFADVVQYVPLVAIDLLICDPLGRLLVGRRVNAPAKGYWFAPGGRIRKGERLDEAFARVSEAEVGVSLLRSAAVFAGVHEHFYEEDFRGEVGAGTHYVVLAYGLQLDPASLDLTTDQHDGYRWVKPEKGRQDLSIHANTRVYFDAPR